MDDDRYENFDLLLERVHDRYEVKVLSSPVGESPTHMFELPLSDIELRNLVLELRHATDVTRSVSGVTPTVSDLVRDVGWRLFDGVFRDQMLSCLHRSIDYVAYRRHAGLRIRLHFSDAPELARLPWEMLYDRNRKNFLGLTQRTPIVRYIELPHSTQPQSHEGPLRMLVMVSSPVDYPRLDVQHELAKLAEATNPLVQGGRLVVEHLPEPTLEALERAGRRPYHLLHYVGHGGVARDTGDGVLVLCDSAGKAELVRGVDLGQQLVDVESLRLVVLNSCRGANIGTVDPFGGTAESLVLQGVPAVVAMQFEITDAAALKFSQSLYEAIADARPVDAAVTQARRTLHAAAGAEWATPVLYMRAPDGRLFEHAIEPSPPLPTPPESRLPKPALESSAVPQPIAEPTHQPPPPPPEPAWGLLLALSPLLCFTLPLPFLVWAIQTGRKDLWVRTAIYALLLVGVFALTPATPEGQTGSGELDTGSTLWVLGWLTLIAVAIVDAFRVRRWVGDASRRTWAREIVAKYPAVAGDWRIGRPDLTHGRLDGSLVDVNKAPVKALRNFLGLRRSEARKIEIARIQVERLREPHDLVVHAGISEATVERIKDRLLFL